MRYTDDRPSAAAILHSHQPSRAHTQCQQSPTFPPIFSRHLLPHLRKPTQTILHLSYPGQQHLPHVSNKLLTLIPLKGFRMRGDHVSYRRDEVDKVRASRSYPMKLIICPHFSPSNLNSRPHQTSHRNSNPTTQDT
ncbi:hypothetical protein JAAARDRAFT_524928 [Jaapia argillacea MUCL 33604]|uniref:Uncharacterized protein n=1 Tax=Jaapia argillacea MUCL 33604 TaxID=933084 RepID=A0A067Q4E1_9AGAM|nr:hypothetical protein JAAARDRAFT_524928 [Jaapia argillacea MUCL 33604]